MSRLCIKSANLGFSRMGSDRQLKHQVEAYWAGSIDEEQLTQSSASISLRHWLVQQSHEIDIIPSNDFSFYDHILDHCILFQVIPKRYQEINTKYQNKYNNHNHINDDKINHNIPCDYQTYFAMARGATIQGDDGNKLDVQPLQMKKWFDTNYHYSVPEFDQNQTFSLPLYIKPLHDWLHAKKNGTHTRPVLIGPISFLMLGKWSHDTNMDSCQDHHNHNHDSISLLRLLPSLLPIYQELFQHLSNAGVTEIQIDEPILITDDVNSETVIQAVKQTYQQLMKEKYGMKFMIATYFGSITSAVLNEILSLPIDGLHVDVIRHGSFNVNYIDTIIQSIQKIRTNTSPLVDVSSSSSSSSLSSPFQLSLGIIDGRNLWISDLSSLYHTLSTHVIERLSRSNKNINLILAPSCSLLHVPYSKELETTMNIQIKTWLSFGIEKLCEIRTLVLLLSCSVPSVISSLLSSNHDAIASRATSPLIHRTDTQETMSIVQKDEITRILYNRKSSFEQRYHLQQQKFKLPKLPTTTIGSFPQTSSVRSARARYLRGALTSIEYLSLIHEWTCECINLQETLDLDVLVHGEFERTDMVEFFAHYLNGYTTTQHGWVQSYGSRCVKPPILYGDVSRIGPMTVDLAVFAQSCTSRPVKGMLTGPVTCLQWSFVRTDIPRKITCQQLAMAIRQEVQDLERAGICMIQIDEPALREGLPLNAMDRIDYVNWSVDCFRLASSGVEDTTQIHSHMCYSDFKDIIAEIIRLDADVLTIEHSRAADDTLLSGLNKYPNALGPGVYDIHTPLIPRVDEMITRIQRFCQHLPIHRIWINPDCGLKTRTQEQVKQALYNMVQATKQCREKIIKAE